MSGQARKKHLVGFETEFLVLEEDGSVSTRADELMKKANACKLRYPLHKDYTHNMVEIASVANVRVRKGVHEWLATVEKVIGIAKKMGMRLYPYGTYTGAHIPTGREDRYYKMCEDVLGPEKYRNNTGKVVGFHFHYCLPYGTFNRSTKSLRRLFHSKYKDQLLNIYNMIIAIDPAVTNFMESSPFVDGLYMAKDSRLFLYRAMSTTKWGVTINGLYRDQPLFGKLPRYAFAISDLVMLSEQRHATWKEMIEANHPEYLDVMETKHPLQFNWGPLRINRVGTFEYRGTDMNVPSHIIGTSVLMRCLLQRVKEEELHVMPSDIGIREPFKIEGQNIYVPPYAYVNEILQYRSALNGMADDEVYRYTKRMAAVALSGVTDKKDPGLERIKHMLRKRRTMSDEILEQATSKGHDLSQRLDEELAREIALKGCERLEDEVRKMMSRELIIDSNGA